MAHCFKFLKLKANSSCATAKDSVLWNSPDPTC